jgi:hypothetical protein
VNKVRCAIFTFVPSLRLWKARLHRKGTSVGVCSVNVRGAACQSSPRDVQRQVAPPFLCSPAASVP